MPPPPYQVTPYVGFRSLIKGKRASGQTFEAQPFMPSSDADPKATPDRKMYMGYNDMEVEESDPTTGTPARPKVPTARSGPPDVGPTRLRSPPAAHPLARGGPLARKEGLWAWMPSSG